MPHLKVDVRHENVVRAKNAGRRFLGKCLVAPQLAPDVALGQLGGALLAVDAVHAARLAHLPSIANHHRSWRKYLEVAGNNQAKKLQNTRLALKLSETSTNGRGCRFMQDAA